MGRVKATRQGSATRAGRGRRPGEQLHEGRVSRRRAADGVAVARFRPARAQVRAVGVTADPEEDTPASVGRFLRARRAEGRLDYLLGDARGLRPLRDIRAASRARANETR